MSRVFGLHSWIAVAVVSMAWLSAGQGAIAAPIGTAKCSGIRGDNATTNPIQKATLETMGRGYKLRFTEMRQGKPVETVWKLGNRLVIESAQTGTASAG